MAVTIVASGESDGGAVGIWWFIYLFNFRGTLEIAHLELLEDANSKCKAANISGKQYLEELILRWDQEGNINNDYENLRSH